MGQNIVRQSVTTAGTVSIGLNDSISSVTVGITGTFAGFAASFEAFDGSAWYPVAANRADGVGADLSVSALSNTTRLWRVNVQGNDAFRVRVTAISSGTAKVTLNASSQVIMDIGSMISAPTPAGSSAIGDVGIQYRANATGAALIKHVISAATTNATNVKNAAGRLVGYRISNTNAAYRYVKFHNTASAPTAGSGVVMTIAVPPNGVVCESHEGGIGFSTGIGITTTTGSADADTAVVGAGDLIIDLFYQ